MTTIGRHNIARMTSFTTGTGTLTLANASPGCLSFADAGVVNAEIVTYTIRDGTNTEVGYGTYTASGTTLSRDTVLSSTNSGNKISCSGGQMVEISIAAEDISPLAYYTSNAETTVNTGAGNTSLTLNTESLDNSSLGTIAANKVTLSRRGYYAFCASIGYYSLGADFNGPITTTINITGTGATYTNEKRGYITAWAVSADEVYIEMPIFLATADAASLVELQVLNNCGANISVYINSLVIKKLENY